MSNKIATNIEKNEDLFLAHKDKPLDLLSGSIAKSLIMLALPITASALASLAFNLVDTFWIGKFLGSKAVAAVGTAGLLLWFMEGMMLLVAIGGQVYVAQSLGNQNIEKARSYVRSTIQLSMILGILSSIFMYFFAPTFIKFFGISDSTTIEMSISYMRVYALGLTFSFLIRSYIGLTTAIGNSKIALRTSIAGIFLNIILDPLFIFTFKGGVFGAALASIISLFVVSTLFIYQLKKNPLFKKQNYLGNWDYADFIPMLKLSAPAAMQTFFLSSISMYIGSIVATFGDGAIAVQKIGVQIESISWQTTGGFSMAINAFTAQNFGANQWQRAKKGYWTALFIISILGFFTTLILYFFAAPLFSLFLDEPLLLNDGVDYLQILSYSQYAMCVEIMTGAAFNGFSKSVLPSSIVVILTLARIPMVYLLAFYFQMGLVGIWWSITISSLAKGLILFISFIIFLNRSEKVHYQEDLT